MDKDDFVVTNVLRNELGIVPYYTLFDGDKHRKYFRGTRKECEQFLDCLCESCCQLLDGKKTTFCMDCFHHKYYVKRPR